MGPSLTDLTYKERQDGFGAAILKGKMRGDMTAAFRATKGVDRLAGVNLLV